MTLIVDTFDDDRNRRLRRPMRKKQMTDTEFKKIADCQWRPVRLIGDGKSNQMQNVPAEKTEYILASGTFIDPRIVELEGINFRDIIGGVEVYWYDENDTSKGFPINKNNEHWLEELPNLPDEIVVIESIGDQHALYKNFPGRKKDVYKPDRN